MARPILRIDVAENSRDFQLVALEPGLPMLDQQNVNSATLFKWLGPAVAEPQWNGQSVRFFVRDTMGGRPENVECQPASEEELEGPLRGDLEQLQERINNVQPENSTEEAIYRIVRDSFEVLVSETGEEDRRYSFFKYRVNKEPWRLVWCWGYQRRDHQPAPVMICTDATCGLLFLRRPGQKPKCPGCQTSSTVLVSRRRSKVPLVAALLLLLLLLGGAGLWWLSRPKLIVAPGEWTPRAGTSKEFTVRRATLFHGRLFGDPVDVTGKINAMSHDTDVVTFGKGDTVAKARGKGTTTLVFLHGDETAKIEVDVLPPMNPDKLVVEPGSIALAVGGTVRPKVTGHYHDGVEADLSESVVWDVDFSASAIVHDGVVEGVSEGDTRLTARYRASPDNEWVETTVDARVRPQQYASLAVSLEPATLEVGERGRLEVTATTTGDEPVSLSGSTKVKLSVEPKGAARLENGYLIAMSDGEGTVKAVYEAGEGKTLEASVAFTVTPSTLHRGLVVYPTELELEIGRVAELSIREPNEPGVKTTVVSSDPEVVAVRELEDPKEAGAKLAASTHRHVQGLKAGTATLTVTRGEESVEVPVTVLDVDLLAQVKGLRFEPPRITVSTGDVRSFRIMGRLPDEREIEVDPERVSWDIVPRGEYAAVNKTLMFVEGLAPTGEAAQEIVVALGDLEAQAAVVVVPGTKAVVGIDHLLANAWKEHGPVDILAPQTVMIGGIPTTVQLDSGTGQYVIRGFDGDARPYGLIVGDRIAGVGDQTITRIGDFDRVFGRVAAGPNTSSITVYRDGVSDPVILTALGQGSPFKSVDVEGPIYDGAAQGYFKVAVDIVADRKQGNLEYRAYVEGTEPPEEWVPAKLIDGGESLTASLMSTDIKQQPGRGHRYALVIEGRTGGAVEKHLYGFSLSLKKTDAKKEAALP